MADLPNPAEIWIVILGNVFDGLEFVGPFTSWDAASEWADPITGSEITGFACLQTPDEKEPGKLEKGK